MTAQEEMKSTQMVHAAFIGSIVIYGGVLKVAHIGTFNDPTVPHLLELILPPVWLVSLAVYFVVLLPRLRAAARARGATLTDYRTAVLLGNAFFESGSIYGMLLVLMGADYMMFVGFAAVTVLLMLSAFPNEEKFKQFCGGGEEGTFRRT